MYHTNEKPNKRKRISTSLRAKLQQEIRSECPFCGNGEVAHFEVHHIDENPSNNEVSNLLLLCRNCHSRITKGEVSRSEVKEKKRSLEYSNLIYCANLVIDSQNCSWAKYDNSKFAFYDRGNHQNKYPIFNLTFLNNYHRTVLLMGIKVRVEHYQTGLSGLPCARVMMPLALYNIEIPQDNQSILYEIRDEIFVGKNDGFKIQIRFFEKYLHEYFPPNGRMGIYLNFCFSDNIEIAAPTIFLNCEYQNQPLHLIVLE